MVPFRKLMPPMLLLMAFKMVLGELAPFSTLLTFSAGLEEWHMAQLAAYTALPTVAEAVAGAAATVNERVTVGATA